MDRRVRRTRRMLSEALFELIQAKDYDSITIQEITDQADVHRATFYLHFATKEELFLEVFKRALARWFDEIGKKLEAGGDTPLDRKTLAQMLADDLAGRPELTRLLGLAHNVVEQNVEIMPAQLFMDHLRQRSLALAATLERRCDALGPGEGAPFLRRLAAVVIGLRQTANPSGLFAALLQDESLAPFRAELGQELRFMIERILPGPGDD